MLCFISCKYVLSGLDSAGVVREPWLGRIIKIPFLMH